jgi:hypothetical protein
MAIEFPNTDPILDPAYAKAEARRHFANQITVARAITDYGAQLLKRLFITVGRGALPDLIAIGLLLRQGIAALDGAVLCMEHGAIGVGHIHARSLFEADLYLQWVLTHDTERWGRQLYVANLRQEREWARRLVPGTIEQHELTQAWQVAWQRTPSESPDIVNTARERIEEVDELLTSDPYQEINGWFDVARNKRPYDPDWFKPGPNAPTSISNMASRLDRQAEYLVLYKVFSYHVHGTRTSTAFSVKSDGLVTIQPVRALVEFPFLFSIVTGLALRLYSRLLTRYRPDELGKVCTTTPDGMSFALSS